MATVGAVCDMSTYKFCLTLVDPNVFYNLVRVIRQQVHALEAGDSRFIGVGHCEVEYETEYSELIDKHCSSSIDSEKQYATNVHEDISIDIQPTNGILPDVCYPSFHIQDSSNKQDNYSLDSWADSGFHESFAEESEIIPV